jgi:hypothetical protein
MTSWQSKKGPPNLTPSCSHMWLLIHRSMVCMAKPDLPEEHILSAAENMHSTLAELAAQAR